LNQTNSKTETILENVPINHISITESDSDDIPKTPEEVRKPLFEEVKSKTNLLTTVSNGEFKNGEDNNQKSCLSLPTESINGVSVTGQDRRKLSVQGK